LRQPGGIGYFITDVKIKDVPVYTRALRTQQPAIQADTVQELAKKLEVDFHALDETIRNYNRALTFGSFDPLKLDGLGTRGLEPPKSNWARSIDQPPYIAYPICCSVVLTFGGVKVDAKARVISCDGQAIRGLYAAGETAGMYYGAYVGSTSVLKGIVFGRVAGACGAQDAGH
jgi:tricarballylate dehydrogenase